MAEKTRGFIADEIRVEPKQYGSVESNQDDFLRPIKVNLQNFSGSQRTDEQPEITKANAGEICSSLGGAFVFANTEDGHEYWVDVMHRLGRIADTGK